MSGKHNCSDHEVLINSEFEGDDPGGTWVATYECDECEATWIYKSS